MYVDGRAGGRSEEVRKAVEILAERNVDFEFDGEVTVNTALDKELLKVADTCSDLLISLYAIHKRKHKITESENSTFNKKFINKWSTNQSEYFKAFQKKMPKKTSQNNLVIISILSSALIILSFFAGRIKSKKSHRLLSVLYWL